MKCSIDVKEDTGRVSVETGSQVFEFANIQTVKLISGRIESNTDAMTLKVHILSLLLCYKDLESYKEKIDILVKKSNLNMIKQESYI